MKKVYLAIPYTGLEEDSFKLANQVSGAMMNKGGYIPLSPISHSHPIAAECEVRGDWEFWEAMDCSFIDWADEVWVINISDELVKNSTGVQAEIAHANKTDKPVKFLEITPEEDWYKFKI